MCGLACGAPDRHALPDHVTDIRCEYAVESLSGDLDLGLIAHTPRSEVQVTGVNALRADQLGSCGVPTHVADVMDAECAVAPGTQDRRGRTALRGCASRWPRSAPVQHASRAAVRGLSG